MNQVSYYIYGNGPFVYYMKQEFEKLSEIAYHRGEERGRFFIIEVDTATFDERIIFEKNINSHEDHFLGLHSADTSDSSFYYEIDSFFLDKKNVYFIESDKIRWVNRLTGKANVIIHAPLLTSVAFDGQYFFILMKNTKLLSMI
ncbi:hypothetical protein AB1K99_13790 [Lederbergia ruris]